MQHCSSITFVVVGLSGDPEFKWAENIKWKEEKVCQWLWLAVEKMLGMKQELWVPIMEGNYLSNT